MRRRALIALAHAGRCTGLALTFAGALVGGVFVHAGTPAFRRTVGAAANRVMGELFAGKIDVDDVMDLSLGRRGAVHARQVKILSPGGTRVVMAHDVRVEIDLLTLARSLATGPEPVVQIERADVVAADVALDLDAAGVPEIARAFAPAPKKETAPRQTESSKDGEPHVHIARATIHSARVRGDLVTPPFDATADEVAAKIDVEDGVARMELLKGEVTLRSPRLPGQWQPLVANAKKASLEVRLDTGSFDGEAEIEGQCGDIPVAARASMHDGVVEASLDIAPASPEAIASAFGEVPITKPVEVHAQARGRLPTLAIEARARAGEVDVSAKGEIELREGNAFRLDVDASRVDAATFGAAVTTDLSGKIHVEGMLGGSPAGTFRATTSEGTVSGEKIPAAIVEGRFDDRRVTATLRAREPGVEASGKIELDVPEEIATFDLQARSDSLRALARAPGVLGGAASARVRGKVDIARRTVDASMVASGEKLHAGALSAGQLNANGRIVGPLASPSIDVELDGTDVRLQSPGKAPLVYPRARGRARVALVPTPRVLDASIDVAAADAPGITASARGIHVTDGAIEARGLEIRGLGEPLELDARVGRDGRWSVRAKSAGVDLRRAADVTGISELRSFPEGTRAALDVDVREGPEGPSGHLDVVVRSDALGARAIVAETHATIERGKLVGNGKVEAEGLARFEITRAELDLPRRIDGQALQRTTGTIELRGSVDLSQGAALFAGEHVERMSGIATFEGRIERGDPDALPAVRGTVRTRGFEVALTGDPPSETVEVSGIDLLAHVAWDGRTEDAEVALLGWDEHGVLASAAVKSKVPFAWAVNARKLDAATLGSLEIDGVLDVPRRDIAALPPMLRPAALRGGVDAHVRVAGTLARPHVDLSARAAGLAEARPAQGGPSFEPLDGVLEGRWDGERAAISFSLDERERQARRERKDRPSAGMPAAQVYAAAERRARTQRKPGHLRGFVLVTDARMADVLERRADLPWKASAELEVENISLAALPLPTGMTGMLTGRASVRDLNRSPSFEAKAHVDDLGAGGARVSSVDLTIGGRDRSLFAHARIEDQDSKATVQVASQSLRVHRLDVDWDPKAPTRVDYAVVNGRLALLAPLVRRSVSELDGRLDGSGSISIDEKSQVFEGGLAIREGRMYVNLIGEEISDVSGVARFEKTGTWRVDGMTGKVGDGEFRASATGRMHGLSFMGADATIVASNGIPLSFEGATFAEATGEVKLSATMSDDRKNLLVTLDIPRANVELPDRNAQQLEPLEPDPTITVGIRRKDGTLDTRAVRKVRGGTGKQRESPRPENALVTRMAVTLGDGVRLEGRGIDVALGGRTLVEIAEEVSVTGRIDLKGGSAIVHGRAFTVDRGTVTFPEGGDPANPTVVAAAYWDAPDRTRVWVEFAGPLKTGKLSLHSEPPLTKNEILSVLLFGRPDPNMAAASTDPADKPGGASGAASGATAVGSGFVTGDLNRLLAEIDPNLDVETDTLGGNRTRTKLGRSFFDRRLKVQVGYAPGRTMYQPDSTFVFLNWQFIPKWSLVATRGDKGTSILDVLFQHRY